MNTNCDEICHPEKRRDEKVNLAKTKKNYLSKKNCTHPQSWSTESRSVQPCCSFFSLFRSVFFSDSDKVVLQKKVYPPPRPPSKRVPILKHRRKLEFQFSIQKKNCHTSYRIRRINSSLETSFKLFLFSFPLE